MAGSGRRKLRPIASAQPARSNIYYNIILSGFSSAMERFASAAARADERSCACLFYADPMVGPDDVVRDRVLHPSAVAHAEAEGPATGCAPKDEKPDPSRFQRPGHRSVRKSENPGHLIGTQGAHQPRRRPIVQAWDTARAEMDARALTPAIVATMMRMSASIAPPGGNVHIEDLYNLNGRDDSSRPHRS